MGRHVLCKHALERQVAVSRAIKCWPTPGAVGCSKVGMLQGMSPALNMCRLIDLQREFGHAFALQDFMQCWHIREGRNQRLTM